jgi:hypothetical protein
LEETAMEQRTRRLIILVGGTLMASAGLFVAACSTDNGTTPLPGGSSGTSGTSGGTDSGKKKDTGGTSSGGEEEDTGAPDDGGSTADCANAPRLRTNTDFFRCAFFTRDAGDDAGPSSSCTNNEICCNPGKTGADFGPSFCASHPAAQKGGDGPKECSEQSNEKTGKAWAPYQSSTWECADKNNCAPNQVCCLFTWADAGALDKVNIGPLQDTAVNKDCKAQQSFKQGGTRCATACATDEIRMCSTSDQNCEAPKVCSPFVSLFRDLGYCK